MIVRLVSLLLMALGLLSGVASAANGEGTVLVGHIDGVINPVTERYVDRLISEGEQRGAAAVVLTIDTPGGLLDSTYAITTRMLNARVPVITYVSPSGGRAASAGTFITLAGHVAAMAPATNIGAARPVSGSGGDIEGDLRTKVENDAVAEITKIALARGRNIDWAASAVRESASVRDDEALALGVVDLISPDVAALLAAVDGRSIALPGGPATIQTAGAAIEDAAQGFFERMLHFIVDPQIAALLFAVGSYGLIIELANPGLIFPGVAGAIAIVLALFSFGSLDANAAGIALMVIAIALFIAESQITSHGLLTMGGAIALLLGMIIALPPFRPTLPGFRTSIDPIVLGSVVVLSLGFFGLIARASFSYLRLPVVSGVNTMIGSLGTAKTDLAPSGVVHLGGEDWSADAPGGPISHGDTVRVLRVDGVRLIVEAASRPEEDS